MPMLCKRLAFLPLTTLLYTTGPAEASASSEQLISVSAKDLRYDRERRELRVAVDGSLGCEGQCSGIVWLEDAADQGAPFEILVGQYYRASAREIRFPVDAQVFSAAPEAWREAELAQTGVDEGISALRSSSEYDVVATQGAFLFDLWGSQTWPKEVRGWLVQDGRTREASLWFQDDDRSGQVLVAGASAHDICSGKGCGLRFDIGEDCWYKFDIGEDCWYKFDIGEDCWYRLEGQDWRRVDGDPDEIWAALGQGQGDDSLYRFDIGEDCWYKFDIGEDCWYKQSSGKWQRFEPQGGTWQQLGSVLQAELRLAPVDTEQLERF